MIHKTDGTLAAGSMELVADSEGHLHLFFEANPEPESPGTQISYMHWDGAGWNPPNDIIVDAAGGQLAHPRVALDSKGNMHLVWISSEGVLNYASNHVSSAGSAWEWSSPVILDSAFAEPDIVIDANDTIFVLYGDVETQSVKSIFSKDGGSTWTSPTAVAVGDENEALTQVGVAIDDTGRLHAVWTGATLPQGIPLTGVYYANSIDGGLTWSVPVQLDDEGHGDINVATIGTDEVHVVWRSGIGGDGTFHNWSADGGVTWNGLSVYDDSGGQSGLPSFAVDSAGTLHYVLGNVYSTQWNGSSLSDYVDVAGPNLRSRGLSTEGAVMAVTRGNQLHVVFEVGFRELWHATQLVDAPATEAVLEPTPHSPVEEPVELSDAVPATRAAVHDSTGFPFEGQSASSRRSGLPIIVGALSSATVVLLAILVARRRH